MKKTIGACMIVKNEAHVITRCLDSLRSLVDYVLVEDTGSTDGTQKVVREWMLRNGMLGMVIDEPWQDFAFNRSHALEALRKLETVDYALIIDADDQLVLESNFNPIEFKNGMRHDLYSIEFQYGDTNPRTRSRLPRLCTNSLSFYFRGVLHEFLEPWDLPGATRVEGFYVWSGRDGARNMNWNKYFDDAATLERALLTEKDPSLVSRYTFYLAQSYRDCGEREKALTNYLKRAQQGFWLEEIFFSLYQAGMLQESLCFPPEAVLATYSRASEASPGRAEALHAAARYSRSLGRYEEGYEYAKRAAAMQMPDVAMLTEGWVYDCGSLEELARNAFCVGRYQECLEACHLLLYEGKITKDMRDAVVKIADFAAGAIAGFYITPHARFPRHADPDGDQKNSEVLENALRLEDDAFLRARYTFYLALSLEKEGERGKALVFTEEAVKLHRELEAQNTDGFLPELASALDNLSRCLRDLDRPEEALLASEEAVRLYRRLSAAQPGAFVQELAAALADFSYLSSNVARREESLAANEEACRIGGPDVSG